MKSGFAGFPTEAMTPFVEFLNAPVAWRRAERRLEEFFV
jgi:hypothetical protein